MNPHGRHGLRVSDQRQAGAGGSVDVVHRTTDAALHLSAKSLFQVSFTIAVADSRGHSTVSTVAPRCAKLCRGWTSRGRRPSLRGQGPARQGRCVRGTPRAGLVSWYGLTLLGHRHVVVRSIRDRRDWLSRLRVSARDNEEKASRATLPKASDTFTTRRRTKSPRRSPHRRPLATDRGQDRD